MRRHRPPLKKNTFNFLRITRKNIPLLQWFEMGATSNAIDGRVQLPGRDRTSSFSSAMPDLKLTSSWFLRRGAGFPRRRSYLKNRDTPELRAISGGCREGYF